MKRRRLNRVVRWGGLVVCAALLGLGVSHLWLAYWWWPLPHWHVTSRCGQIGLSWNKEKLTPHRLTKGSLQAPFPLITYRPWPAGQGSWWPVYMPLSARGRVFAVIVGTPLWLPLALAAVPTALAWRSHHRRRRIGLCPECRYDLSGLPAAAPCPECGRARA